ncbi:MAG TPA: hypothetical protein VKY85_07620 [Candidatus Angelobacter sp.]|nr:hypothetical protein [Candidatus Angelobacter sp.]
MRFLTKTFGVFLMAVLASMAALGQSTLQQTTLSAAVNGGTSATGGVVLQTQIQPASLTGFTAPTQGNQNGSIVVVDTEFMQVLGVNASTGLVSVARGIWGTQARGHVSGATVYVGPPNFFKNFDPNGSCTASLEPVLPTVSAASGDVFTCDSNTNIWVRQASPWPYKFTDGAIPFTFSQCNSSVSGNSTGTNGFTTTGASATPVVQAQTSSTGTNTHTYVCKVHVPQRLSNTQPGKGVYLTNFVFYYGVQGGALGTQANTLASGTFNSSIVFGQVTYPASGASETPSTVAPARLDSGTMAITPVVGSFNTATTTAGAFYTVTFTPASPILLQTDLQDVVLTVTFQCAATTATTTNSPGGIIHYTYYPI